MFQKNTKLCLRKIPCYKLECGWSCENLSVLCPEHLALLQKAKPYLKCYFPLRLNGANVNSWSLRFSNWVNPLSRNSMFYWAINHLLRNFDGVCCLLQGDAQKGETGERGPGVCAKLECVSDKWSWDSVTDWLDPAVQLQNWLLLTRALDGQTDRISEGELWEKMLWSTGWWWDLWHFPMPSWTIWERLKWQRHFALLLVGIFS